MACRQFIFVVIPSPFVHPLGKEVPVLISFDMIVYVCISVISKSYISGGSSPLSSTWQASSLSHQPGDRTPSSNFSHACSFWVIAHVPRTAKRKSFYIASHIIHHLHCSHILCSQYNQMNILYILLLLLSVLPFFKFVVTAHRLLSLQIKSQSDSNSCRGQDHSSLLCLIVGDSLARISYPWKDFVFFTYLHRYKNNGTGLGRGKIALHDIYQSLKRFCCNGKHRPDVGWKARSILFVN